MADKAESDGRAAYLAFLDERGVQGNAGDVAPPMPNELVGYRIAGELATVFHSVDSGLSGAIIPDFPATMNGCDLRRVTVRWRAVGDYLLAAPTYYPPSDGPYPTMEDLARYEGDDFALTPAFAGAMILDGCQQPVFFSEDPSASMHDVVVEYQEWVAAA